MDTKTDSGSRLGVIDFTGKENGDDGQDTAFQKTGDLTIRVDLASEDALAELVLGTHGGGTLDGGAGWSSAASQHGSLWVGETNGGLDTCLDVVSDFAVKGSVDSALGLELSSSDPIRGNVSSDKREGGVRRVGCLLGGVDGLKTKSELGGNGLEERNNADTGEGSVEDGGVERLKVERKVGALEVVLELEHGGLALGDLHVGLGDGVGAPAVVESAGDGEVTVDITLQQGLVGGIESSKAVFGHYG